MCNYAKCKFSGKAMVLFCVVLRCHRSIVYLGFVCTLPSTHLDAPQPVHSHHHNHNLLLHLLVEQWLAVFGSVFFSVSKLFQPSFRAKPGRCSIIIKSVCKYNWWAARAGSGRACGERDSLLQIRTASGYYKATPRRCLPIALRIRRVSPWEPCM